MPSSSGLADSPETLMAFWKFGEKSDEKQATAQEIIQQFERELKRQETILYGVALFFEAFTLLNAGQEAMLETYRKQFRNIIRNTNQSIQQASALLQQARQNPAKVSLLHQFRFAPCQGHPEPAAMARRAEVIATVYQELFPDRPMDQAFTEGETFELMEAAGERLAQIEAARSAPASAPGA